MDGYQDGYERRGGLNYDRVPSLVEGNRHGRIDLMRGGECARPSPQ